ncbi:MAG: PhzF family phenazine biosynthesis protein [Gammaproteobacteria bacterium]|nr:PhzF family phenazine biosynthesis protein [Gammaproteobacteria bacterium]
MRNPMTLDMFIIDAFAERTLTGNPAAVCPLDAWIADDTMQAIAQEMNLSETVFFVPNGDVFEIRWFTPVREVDMIGHATLAAGHLILDRIRPEMQQVKFLNPTGDMVVSRDGNSLIIDMPALVPHPVPGTTALESALGKTPREVLASKHYLCVFDNEDTVAGLEPDFVAMANLDLPAVIVTAPGSTEFDFVSRFFAPANGVPEDSVSGVAHCCLTPFWSERLGISNMKARQLSSRGGVIYCEFDKDRVRLAGSAITFLEGQISI